MSTCITEKRFLYSLLALGSLYIPKVVIDNYRAKYKDDLMIDKINSVVTKIYPFLLVISLLTIFLSFSRGDNLTEKLTSTNGQYILLSTFFVCLALYIKVVIRPDYYYKNIRVHSFVTPLFITGIISFNYIIFIQAGDKRISRIIFTIISTILVIVAERLTSEELETTSVGHIMTTISYIMVCLNNSIV